MASSLWSRAGGASSANRRPLRIIPKTQTSNYCRSLAIKRHSHQKLKKIGLVFYCSPCCCFVRSTLFRGKAVAAPDHTFIEQRSLTPDIDKEEKKTKKERKEKERKKEKQKGRKKKDKR